MCYTDDPVADFHRHDARLERELKKLPKCAECGERIQTDECYEINETIICPKCLRHNYMRWTEDFIEE